MHALVLLCISQRTKFEVHRFTNSKDTIGCQNLINGSRDSAHAHWESLSRPGDVLYPHVQKLATLASPFRRYDWEIRNWIWVMWPDHSPFRGGLSSKT